MYFIGTIGKRLRKKRARRFRGSQAGQAIVEYILILVIVVIIILSLLYRFHSSFKIYTEAFFDGYIACLLELGELPGNGGTCDAEFAGYDPKSGKMLVKDKIPGADGSGGGTGGSGAGNGNEGDGAKDSGGDPQKAAGSTAGAGRETVPSAGGGGRRGSTNMGNFGRMGRNRSTRVGQASSAKSDSALEGEDSLLGNPSNARVGNYYSSERRAAVKMNFSMFGDEEQQRQAGRPPAAVAAKASKEEGALKAQKALEPPPAPVQKTKDMDTDGFSFGAIIRWLLLGAMILAIVVFLGGQILQFAKSREKGGD